MNIAGSVTYGYTGGCGWNARAGSSHEGCAPGAPENPEPPQGSSSGGATELSDEEQQQVRELQSRDREVRAHEMAHVAAGGQYVRGGASFEFQTGPDGRQYAVGGEVSIDTSEVPDDPQATAQKMQVVKRAALAPAKPSAQDRSVAAQASQKEAQARQELREEKTAETNGDEKKTPNTSAKTAFYTKNGITHSFHHAPSPALFDATV